MDWASSTVPKQPNVVQQKRTICTSGRPLLQSASLFAAKASSDLLIGLSSNTRGDFVRWGPGDRKHSSHSCLRAAVIFGAFFFCCSRRRQPARWRGHLARASKFDGKWYINCTPPPPTPTQLHSLLRGPITGQDADCQLPSMPATEMCCDVVLEP